MTEPERSVAPLSHPHQQQEPEGTLPTGLLMGATLPPALRAKLYELIGRELPDSVWEHTPTGSRILVAPEPVSETTSGGVLWKPRSMVERQKMEMGAGWIIAVGPHAGDLAPHPGGMMTATGPADLLGLHVLFKSYSGVSLRIAEDEEEFGGSLLVMTDRDILAVGKRL
ncbi:MAG: hypothetical protein L0191_08575 [Acidobacteria bacterium]|nr:hypothetical protein [Acidobacteriota bacterium]